MEPNNPNSIKERVMSRVRDGGLSRRPKLYFILSALLTGFVALLTLALSIFLLSFIFFSMRINGHDALLGFGSRGLLVFLELFPWTLLLVDIGLLVLLEWLLRRFKFGYRSPVLYLLFALVVIVGASSVVVDRGARVHDTLFEASSHHELFEPFESFYEGSYHKPPEQSGVYRGVIIEIQEKAFLMQHDDLDEDDDDDEEVWRVEPVFEIVDGTFMVGDRIYVAGDEEGEVIRAYGVRLIAR